MSADAMSRASIGVVTSARIGDSLLLGTLGENLRRHGYATTVYSDPLAALAPLIPDLHVEPFPADAIDTRLSRHDLVLYDNASPLTGAFRAGRHAALEERSICYALTKGGPGIRADHASRIRRLHPSALAAQLLPFARCNALLRDPANPRGSMVDHLCYVAQALIGCAAPTRANGIARRPRAGATGRRVLIHPTASTALKEWPAQRFVALARALRCAGYEPVFTVAPHEREPWLARLAGEFELPPTPDLLALARCCEQARLLVGSDSGNAHLASALGLPVVLVINRRKPYYRWRPDWSPCRIVYPLLSRRLVGRRWGYFLSVHKVIDAIRAHDSLQAGTGGDALAQVRQM
jgi:hypothetical protein